MTFLSLSTVFVAIAAFSAMALQGAVFANQAEIDDTTQKTYERVRDVGRNEIMRVFSENPVRSVRESLKGFEDDLNDPEDLRFERRMLIERLQEIDRLLAGTK
jgi:hypothetical protein